MREDDELSLDGGLNIGMGSLLSCELYALHYHFWCTSENSLVHDCIMIVPVYCTISHHVITVFRSIKLFKLV
jgi:hypothetical protein